MRNDDLFDALVDTSTPCFFARLKVVLADTMDDPWVELVGGRARLDVPFEFRIEADGSPRALSGSLERTHRKDKENEKEVTVCIVLYLPVSGDE